MVCRLILYLVALNTADTADMPYCARRCTACLIYNYSIILLAFCLLALDYLYITFSFPVMAKRIYILILCLAVFLAYIIIHALLCTIRQAGMPNKFPIMYMLFCSIFHSAFFCMYMHIIICRNRSVRCKACHVC